MTSKKVHCSVLLPKIPVAHQLILQVLTRLDEEACKSTMRPFVIHSYALHCITMWCNNNTTLHYNRIHVELIIKSFVRGSFSFSLVRILASFFTSVVFLLPFSLDSLVLLYASTQKKFKNE